MRLKSKQSCVDCHFFVKTIKDPQRGPIEIEASEREKARQEDYSWVVYGTGGVSVWLACSFGVWDEGYNKFDRAKRYQVIVEKDQGDSCFWWPYNPAMLIPAAKILQEREARNRDAEHDRSLTRRGLKIATIALFINAAGLFVNAGLKVYELFFSRT